MGERKPVSAEVRIRVLKRDRFRCTYCGASGNDVELEIDHIIPVAEGGSKHMSNLTTACKACNMSKGKKQDWSPKESHFPGVIGKAVHVMLNGEINNQGEIIGESDNTYMIQLFSWIDGRDTKIKEYPKADCVLYATFEEMRKEYTKSLHKD